MRKKDTSGSGELSIRNEIIGIFLLFFTFFLLFSLISYTPHDASFFHAGNQQPVSNFGGRIGSELAALLFNIFGFAALAFIFFLLFYTAYFFLNRKIPSAITKSLGFLLLLIFSSACLANLIPTIHIVGSETKTGGMLGYFINAFFEREIKHFFSLLLFVSCILISLVLIAKISMQKILIALVRLLYHSGHSTWKWLSRQWQENRKRRRFRMVKKKYDRPEPEPQTETVATPASEIKAPRKRPERQPSRLPEESYLFSELSVENTAGDNYKPPPISYLDAPSERSKIDGAELEEKQKELAQRLQDFRINGQIVEYTPGPVVTTFEFVPDVGVKVKDVSNLTEDLALAVKAPYVRIERIMGKKAIGIEIPNNKRETIHLRELLESPFYRNSSSPLTIALGKTTSGEIFVSDLREMPHLLIAGATGSGKSVVIHSIILSILFKSSPKTVKFILIDPKHIEMIIYNSLPHLLTPVVVQPKLAQNALDWAVWEMDNRYKKLACLQVRNIEQYNKKLELMIQTEDEALENLEDKEKIPYIIIIIDELADLLMVSAREIEEDIARIAQKARAVGIHLILATQRPSIDVITGTIKNNFSSRIALAVPSKHDSRTIIDQIGAEKLLGKGDMLFLPPKTASLIRLHGSFVSEEETIRIVKFLSEQKKPEFNTQIIRHSVKKEEVSEDPDRIDDLFFEAAEVVITSGQASASFLQRRMSVGYARAGRLMDQLQAKGVVSAPNNKNQREVLMTLADVQNLKQADA